MNFASVGSGISAAMSAFLHVVSSMVQTGHHLRVDGTVRSENEAQMNPRMNPQMVSFRKGKGGSGFGPLEGWVVLLGLAVVRFLVLAALRFGDSVRRADRRAVFNALIIDLALAMLGVTTAAASGLIRPDHVRRSVVAAMIGWFLASGCVIGAMSARCALDLEDGAVSGLAYAAALGASVGAAGFS